MEQVPCILMYLRLSKEEEEGERESSSIANQRRLLLSYIKEKEEWQTWQVTELVDDGYTGTNLKRPGLLAMLHKCSKQEVQVVIVKDFSRFSRDYLTLGTYMEQVFPSWGVRFVSVNDGYDSKMVVETAAIDVPFRGLLYDSSSKDISRKVKTALAARKQQGIYAVSRPPLGYRRNDRGILMVDEEGAVIVRLLYRLAEEGMGLTQIAGYLNDRQIPTPAARERMRTARPGYATKGELLLWTASQVRQILCNPFYLGWFVSGKYQTKRPGSRPVPVPEGEQMVQKGHHEPLVSEEQFQLVQLQRNKKSPKTNPNGRSSPRRERHPLQGKVRHSSCGHSMAVRHSKIPYFYCPYAGDSCKECRILASVFSEIASWLFEKWFYRDAAKDGRIVAAATAVLQEVQDRRVGKLHRLKVEREAIYKACLLQYEAFTNKSLEREAFQSQRQRNQESLQRLEEQIEKEQRGLERLRETAKELTGDPFWEREGGKLFAEVVKEIRVDEANKLILSLRISHQRG